MTKLTALEIADQVDAYVIRTSIGAEAAAMLRKQHAEIERLKSDAELVNSCAKNPAISMHRQHFSHITQWEPLPDTIGLITQIDNMSCWLDSEIERLKAKLNPAAHVHRPDCYGPQIGTRCMGCTMAEREAYLAEYKAHVAEIDRLKRERQHIYDLLARIHRDGGQYAAEHGVEKSCDDAEAQVVTWLKTISEVDSLIEQARVAERNACAAVCENGSFLHDAAPTAIFGKECARAIRARSAT